MQCGLQFSTFDTSTQNTWSMQMFNIYGNEKIDYQMHAHEQTNEQTNRRPTHIFKHHMRQTFNQCDVSFLGECISIISQNAMSIK